MRIFAYICFLKSQFILLYCYAIFEWALVNFAEVQFNNKIGALDKYKHCDCHVEHLRFVNTGIKNLCLI